MLSVVARLSSNVRAHKIMRAKIVIFLIIISTSVCAEIEKVALPGDNGFQFYWWPKLVPFKEWHHDRDASLHYQVNAMVPDLSLIHISEPTRPSKSSRIPSSA